VDPTRIENAAEYAGTYQPCRESSGQPDSRVLTLVAEGERLTLSYGGERIALERRGPDRFYVDHPEFALFLLRFGREREKVVEAVHGPDWYTNDRYDGPKTFDSPQEWAAYPGHYRSHNPWLLSFKVVLRKGALALVEPSGHEEPLVPLGSGVFRVRETDRSPERIRFDAIIDGRALRARLSGEDFYATVTPWSGLAERGLRPG
jgi:hypothetical protein